MANWMRNRQVLVTLCALLTVCITCSSCESLQKKFTRKKKKGQEENVDFNPVLEPQDYPAPEYNAVELYKEHYGLIRVWYSDLVSGVNDRQDTDNKVRYAIKQVNVHIDAMRELLDKDKQPALEELRGMLTNYVNALETPRMTRNKGKILSDLRAFDRKLRRELRLDVIKRDLVKVEPPH